MAGLVQYISDGYNYLFDELHHPISKDWFLAGSPFKILCILATYNYFCLKLGPELMKHREPFQLKNVIMIYNVFQILISLYMVIKGTPYIFSKEFDYRCASLDDPTSEKAALILPLVYIFYIVKIIDLMDTVFFVLRKSNRQITSLHMHHHTLMPMAGWLAITYVPGGQSIIIGYINSFVHTIMYFYYLLAGLGDKYKQSLWWKKYITLLQLVQFMIFTVQSITSLFHQCNYPYSLRILMVCYSLTFMNMFSQFYYNTYVKKTDKQPINDQNGTHKAKRNKDL